jgi:prevent-host-death family protein
MGTHSIAEAKNRLPELIDRALKGERVIITRYGRPLVELKSIPQPARPVSAADLDRLAAHRVKLRSKAHRVKLGRKPKNAGELVSEMRDEENR